MILRLADLPSSFLIARFTPQMFTAMGYGVYMFFATLMILSIFYVYVRLFRCPNEHLNLYNPPLSQFILPETKQVPLERMEELFAPGLKPWRAHGVVMGRIHDANAARKLEEGSHDSLEKVSHEHTERAC
jgi:hypothetical protein